MPRHKPQKPERIFPIFCDAYKDGSLKIGQELILKGSMYDKSLSREIIVSINKRKNSVKTIIAYFGNLRFDKSYNIPEHVYMLNARKSDMVLQREEAYKFGEKSYHKYLDKNLEASA